MDDWTPVLELDQCPPDSIHEVIVDGHILALTHVDGEFFAMEGICPHQGGPLGRGTLVGCTITCPWHGWQFEAKTGQHAMHAHLRQTTWETCLRDDKVWVRRQGSVDSTLGQP